MISDSDWDFLCNEILTLIEIQEARLLNWGFVNARIDLEKDLGELINNLPPKTLQLWEEAHQQRFNISDIIKNLVDRRLVLQFRDNCYSSRFAQTVRYLFLLRQLLPNRQWQTSAALVSDMRIHLQRRRYPNRDRSISQVISTLDRVGFSSIQKKVIEALLVNSKLQPISLSRFQVEAAEEILRSLTVSSDQAVVVGAGTGSGKTKAFYLPALAHIVSNLQINKSIQVLALYPRTELLKDQAGEAYLEARKLDSLLAENNLRKISIGIYYGETPESAAKLLQYPSKAWKNTADLSGLICPYFSCPNQEDGHGEKRDMIWSKTDLQLEVSENQQGRFGNYARLRCVSCGYEVKGDTLFLTRQQMIQNPPDILFTSTEMLNRRMSRVDEFSLFGIHTAYAPKLVLLDEIHTYEGIHGAQVAYLIRRWRAARRTDSNSGVCIVGLSATLTQAESFFARFTGIPQHQVRYITPLEVDLVEEGMEYNMVLKGDPVSQASLLSTSVQTVMLMARMLDVPNSNLSNNAFGTRVFAFADMLDVVNRWAHIEKDAEENKRLARLRKSSGNTGPTILKQYEAGQLWPFCEKIGHSLDEALKINVVSSQYRGIDSKANVVLATSALEVGFNDTKVGAVVQHKAPRDMASLLQRKGRAGRLRGMRPWMVIVTSDYGRDRWAFQHSEQLFDPLLPPLEMPVENYYVRKIQSVLVLMDWLAIKLKNSYRYADIWETLSPTRQNPSLQPIRKKIVDLLQDILKNKPVAREFVTYLQKTLQLEESDVNLLLWGEPRALLLEVIPTIIRKIDTNWRRVLETTIDQADGLMVDSPMPEFVPSSLFSNLNLLELSLVVPHYTARNSKQSETVDEHIDMILGINDYAPGNVKKRFAHIEDQREAHWLALPEDAQLTRGKLPLDYLSDPEHLTAKFVKERVVKVEDQEYIVLRPEKYILSLTPTDVLPSSTGRLDWKSFFLLRSHYEHNFIIEDSHLDNEEPVNPRQLGTTINLSPFSAWQYLIRNITSYNQTNGEWVDITRFAPRVIIETRRERDPHPKLLTLDFEWDGNLASIGYTLEVDALSFTLEPLDIDPLCNRPDWPDLYRTLVPEYFRDRLLKDRRIKERGLSSFTIEWLYQVEKAALTAYAIGAQISLEEAAQGIQSNRTKVVERVMKIIFQSLSFDEDEDIDLQQEKQGRLFQTIQDLMGDPEILTTLQEHEKVLWSPPDDEFRNWLSECYVSSLGAAIFSSICRVVPDIQPEDLVLDITQGKVWISETVSGGVGLISRIAESIGQQPRDFELLLMDSIQHCDREHLSHQLNSIVKLIQNEAFSLEDAFATIRDTNDLPKILNSMNALKVVLEKYGVLVDRELIIALNARLLRPNSNSQLDYLVSQFVLFWETEEQRLRCVIDLRVIAVAGLQRDFIVSALDNFLNSMGMDTVDENQKFNILQSLLWLDCKTSCPDCIQTRNRYQDFIQPSRKLLLSAIAPYMIGIIFGSSGWVDQVNASMEQEYQAKVTCQLNEIESCKQRLMEIIMAPIEVGFQLFYPYVERIDRKDDQFVITLAIRELMGA